MATVRFPTGALRRPATTLTLLAAAALSASCTSTAAPVVGGSTASTGSSATTASSAGSPAATSAGATTGSGATGAAQPAPPQGGPGTCLTRYLHGDIGLSQGAAGSVYVDITFKNLDNAACTLQGYPGVSFGAGTPVSQVGQPASRNNAVTAAAVTLAPGGYAYATLQITDAGNYPEATCDPVATTWLQVYPPNNTGQLYIPYNSTACSANVVTLSVQAVQPGNGGG